MKVRKALKPLVGKVVVVLTVLVMSESINRNILGQIKGLYLSIL